MYDEATIRSTYIHQVLSQEMKQCLSGPSRPKCTPASVFSENNKYITNLYDAIVIHVKPQNHLVPSNIDLVGIVVV